MKQSFKFLILMLFAFSQAVAQSITLDPSSSSTINTSRGTNYIDINKTATNNTSGLRFLQNSVLQGGLFFNEDFNYFNLGNGAGTPGLVWNRGTQRVGIGTLSPTAKLQIVSANSSANPHLLIQETVVGVGGRIVFENTNVANKNWTLFARNSSTATDNVFNVFHNDFGNVAQFYSDGNTDLNGFTKLGSDAPKVKMKKLSGTTNSNSSSTTVNHGLNGDKILAIDVWIKSTNGVRYPPHSHQSSTNTYRIRILTGDIIMNDLEADLRDRPYTILITYEE